MCSCFSLAALQALRRYGASLSKRDLFVSYNTVEQCVKQLKSVHLCRVECIAVQPELRSRVFLTVADADTLLRPLQSGGVYWHLRFHMPRCL